MTDHRLALVKAYQAGLALAVVGAGTAADGAAPLELAALAVGVALPAGATARYLLARSGDEDGAAGPAELTPTGD